MKIYFAAPNFHSGSYKDINEPLPYGLFDLLHRAGAVNLLISYADILEERDQNYLEKLDEMKAKNFGFNLMLDSGAYSVWKKGKKINIYDYIDFIKKEGRKRFNIIVGLDVIFNWKGSLENYKIMLKEGIKDAIPVWHYPEPWKVLDIYCNELKAPYIGIGGIVNLAANPIMRANIIGSALKHIPAKTKTHLFGMNSVKVLKMFPQITSADSSSWLWAARTFCLSKQNGAGTFHYQWKAQRPSPMDFFIYNIRKMLEVEQFINEAHEKR